MYRKYTAWLALSLMCITCTPDENDLVLKERPTVLFSAADSLQIEEAVAAVEDGAIGAWELSILLDRFRAHPRAVSLVKAHLRDWIRDPSRVPRLRLDAAGVRLEEDPIWSAGEVESLLRLVSDRDVRRALIRALGNSTDLQYLEALKRVILEGAPGVVEEEMRFDERQAAIFHLAWSEEGRVVLREIYEYPGIPGALRHQIWCDVGGVEPEPDWVCL